MDASVFASHHYDTFKYRYTGRIKVGCLVGGTPTDPRKAEAWLRSKLADNEALIQRAVAEIVATQQVSTDEAVAQAADTKTLNGFKRDEDGLYIEGRQLKAALKEAVNVAVSAGHLEPRGWGKTNKGVQGFVAEHMFVTDDRLYIYDKAGKRVLEPTGVTQRFVHTWRGSGIQQEEYVEDAYIDFTIIADVDFEDACKNPKGEFWPTVWVTGELQGIGATRSMGFGTYKVIDWRAMK